MVNTSRCHTWNNLCRNRLKTYSMSDITLHKSKNAAFIGKDTSNFRSVKNYGLENAAVLQKPLASKTRQTVFFHEPVYILSGGSVAAQREGDGPIGTHFDYVIDAKEYSKNFELQEVDMLKRAIRIAVEKGGLMFEDVDMLLAGDLLNQLTSSSYAARDLGLPYIGLYSACSTMSQALAVGASFLNAGYFKHVACATVSHFATAERQYRSPLEYGAQRPPYAQWTVTGAGCTILTNDKCCMKGQNPQSMPRITSATYGKVLDFGIKDVANMGVAMAPA